MSEFSQPYSSVFLTAKISTASSGALTAIAAVTGKVIQVYKIILVAAGTTTVTMQDGATALTGAMSMAVGIPLILSFDGNPWFTTTAGNAFEISNGSAIQISGIVYYTQGFPTTQ